MNFEHSLHRRRAKRGDQLRRSPRQQALLAIFAELQRPTSASQLSALTGETLGATAHHVRNLARQGLIERAGERRMRGARQTFYTVTDDGHAALRRLPADSLLFLAGSMISHASGRPTPVKFDDEAIDQLQKLIEKIRPELAAILPQAD